MQHQSASRHDHGDPDHAALPALPGIPPRHDVDSSASSVFQFISGHHETYSDQDIELVHEIVTLAESLYPTLPERERLPTNALFLAAEEILPHNGHDVENIPSHIARLIFKIGGQRSGNTLSDKFRSVLEGLGIQLEFVPSSPSARPESRASFALSETHTTDLQPNHYHNLNPQPQGHRLLERVVRRGRGQALSDTTGPASSPEPIPFRPKHQGPIPQVPVLPAVVDLEDNHLEEKLQRLRMQEDHGLVNDILGVWCANARQTKRENDELQSIAIEYDNNDLLGEVLDIWHDEAAAAEQRRLEAEAALEHEAYVAKMERRATRVYEIFTARNVLAHWREQAFEEMDRTAVARRHLVRKRTFEGWHAQHVEDETKIRNFILGNVLRKWSEVALHHEVRHEVAARWHDRQLCKHSLQTMWDVFNNRLADELYAVGLVTQCLDTWTAKGREARDEYQVAVALDERLVLDEAVSIWLDEVEAQQYHAHECTRQWLILGCRRDLDYWQEQARLSALLRRYNATQDLETERETLCLWQAALRDAEEDAAVADTFLLREPVDHWEREMKLKLLVERDEYETKVAVIEHWALEEKLAWFKRYSAKTLKQRTLDTLLTAAQQSRGERERHEEEAAYIDSYYTQVDAVDTWLSGVDQMWKHRHNADLVNLYRTTRPCIDRWREQCQQSQARAGFYRRRADKHRARSIVTSVLHKWPEVAEAARRERMMTSLRQFRRQYKVELAQDCLGKWLDATADALDADHDAHQTNLYYKREDLNDCLGVWNRSAQRLRTVHQIAAEAELEVYCGKWQEQLQEAKENLQDAIEYDAEQIRKRCWEKWEFETLQSGGKRHLAITLQEKNERRVRRRILGEWHQKAVPGAADRIDPRLSTLSARRSVRQQLARSSTAGGFYTASQLATLRPRDSVASTQSLGPMPEFDEDPLVPDLEDPGFMSTPTKWRGSTRTLGHRLTSTPSAILASPYERELRRQYGAGGLLRPRVEFADINEESGEDLYQ